VLFRSDDLGRLMEMTDRDGGKVTYAYDDNGNLTEVHRANETWTEIKYDDEDRVVAIENHGYFTIGKWHVKSVLSSKYTYSYDGSGNIVYEGVYEYITDCGLWGFIKYIFTRLKNEHIETHYTYDSRNQITDVNESKKVWFKRTKTHDTSYSYDLSGNRTKKVYDSVETVYTYNDAGQLLTEKTGKKTISYTYDANGNLISKSSPACLGKTNKKTYEYDNENRLKAVKENGTLLMAMLYDGDGIRTFTAEKTENPCKVIKNAFELSPIPGSFNQSAGSSGSNSNSSESNKSIYDLLLVPNGVSSKKYAYYDLTQYFNNVNTEYAQVLLERAADGKTKSVYEYGMFRERAEINGADYTYEYDGRGSVIALTTSTSKKVTTYSYDEYGVTTSAGQCVDNPYRYNAEYTDDLTGMQYLRARYYRAQTGSFITADTYAGRITTPLSLNRYTYVHNNPMLGKDPSGHFVLTTMLICAGVGAAIGAGVSAYKEYKTTKSDSSHKFNGWNVVKGALVGGVAGAAAYTVGAAVATSTTVKSVASYVTAKLTSAGVKYSLASNVTKWSVAGISGLAGGMTSRAMENTWSTILNYKYGMRYSDPVTAATDSRAMISDFVFSFGLSAGFDGFKRLINKIKNDGGITSWIKHFCGDAKKLDSQSITQVDDKPLLGKYKDLPKQIKSDPNLTGQANHLNQNAVYGKNIPHDEGIACALEGNVFTEAGSPHNKYHAYLEDNFWDLYRKGGSLYNSKPTNDQYLDAVYDALIDAGYNKKQAMAAVKAAKDQQIEYGLLGSDLVPRIPGKTHYKK